MSLFKKLFSSSKNKTQKQPAPSPQQSSQKVDSIYTDTYFEKRYTEDPLEASVIEGSIKMIESYYEDDQLERKIETPVNHPINLDQVVHEGMGFHMYCQAFQLEDKQVVAFLAFSFNDFMIKNFGFKLYKDSEPEFPLRAMTLKYNKNGAVISLYPIEYALKVLNHESTFEEIYLKIKNHLENMPDVDEVLKKFTEGQTNQ